MLEDHTPCHVPILRPETAMALIIGHYGSLDPQERGRIGFLPHAVEEHSDFTDFGGLAHSQIFNYRDLESNSALIKICATEKAVWL